MSAISLKSITGITSITTPAGVDNQLTLHTNNTTERVKIDVAGNVHVNNHLNITGVTTHNEDVWFKGATSGRDVYWDKSANELRFNDNAIIYLGSNKDAFLSHDGSSTRLQDNYGHFFIGGNLIQIKSGNLSEEYARMDNTSKEVKLFHNSIEKFTTKSTGIVVHGTTTTTGLGVTSLAVAGVTTVSDNIEVVDSKHVYWGTGKDLSITHNGTHGYLHSINGGFYMKVGNGEFLSRNGNQVIAKFLQGTGGVELYNNNEKKAYTENNGFYITDTGRAAMARVIAPAGYDARIDLTADTHGNEDNYRIEVNTDQKFRVYGKPGGNYTSFIELDQTGQVTLTRDVDVARHLDVGGHTELDNVNIVGVTTHNGQSKFYGNGGASLIWGDTGYSGHLSFDGSNNAVVRAASGKALVFQTNHVNTRMTIGSQGNVSINNDLDVDGHTNLDNVTIAGITTFTNVVTKFKANNGGNTHLQILSTGSGEAGIFFDAANGDIAGSDYAFIGQQNNLDFVIKANPNAGNIDFQRGSDTKVRIDTNGRVLFSRGGLTASRNVGTKTGEIQVANSGNSSAITIIGYSNDVTGPHLMFGKTRSTNATGNTIVQNGDRLGEIAFCGNDGSDLDSFGAAIKCHVDGTPGSNDMPGRLQFYTTPDGGSSSLERLRITSEGYLHLGNSGHGTNKVGGQAITGQDLDAVVKLYSSNSNLWLAQLRADNTSTNGVFLRSGNSSSTYTLYATGYHENNPHLIVRGDGAVLIGESTQSGMQRGDVVVHASVQSGNVNEPAIIHRNSTGAIIYFEHYFYCNKGGAGNSHTVNQDIIQIQNIGNFHQAVFHCWMGVRLQGQGDSYTRPATWQTGVNRFNGGSSIQFEENWISADSQVQTYANLHVGNANSTSYYVRMNWPSGTYGSSFAGGKIMATFLGCDVANSNITFAYGRT